MRRLYQHAMACDKTCSDDDDVLVVTMAERSDLEDPPSISGVVEYIAYNMHDVARFDSSRTSKTGRWGKTHDNSDLGLLNNSLNTKRDQQNILKQTRLRYTANGNAAADCITGDVDVLDLGIVCHIAAWK